MPEDGEEMVDPKVNQYGSLDPPPQIRTNPFEKGPLHRVRMIFWKDNTLKINHFYVQCQKKVTFLMIRFVSLNE
jgi:hypothetical protein